MRLSGRQAEALAFVRDYIAERGYAPTLAEIARWLGVSKQMAHRHVQKLEDKGAIAREVASPRTIRVVAKGQPFAASPQAYN